MLTAMNSARLRDEACAAGADLFLAKPVNPERFLSEARRLLGPQAEEHV
jgi:CheY-like chemotaxis protein